MEKPFKDWSPADRERVLAELERILQSRTFAAASRLQHLLRYLVTETVSGRGERLNQMSIAIDVLGRDQQFDPQVDSVVRVEAGRLRGKLRDYYHDEGAADPVRIELGKGGYAPSVKFIPAAAPGAAAAAAADAPSPAPATAARMPARRGTRREFLLGAGLTLVVLAAILLFFGEVRIETSPSEAVARPAESHYDGAKSIAVLPFQNSSAATEDAGFFADGLHDDLLTQLTKIADLKVISRTSVMGYKGVQKPIPQIARELDVHAVLEGAVQRAGNRVRVNVQLIDGRSDQHLWAESFDQELNASNIFEIQRRIAVEIAGALRAKLSPQEQGRIAQLPTQNLEAYEHFMRARQQIARRSREGLETGLERFRRAVELDPAFALAHSGIAETAYLLYTYGWMNLEDMRRTVHPALARAFELDDQIGEAWTVQGAVRVLEDDHPGAEQAFRRAIELNPNYAQAYHWYGSLLEKQSGREEETLRMARRARDLDPLSPLLRANLAVVLEELGRFDEAQAEIERALELDPHFAASYGIRGFIALLDRHDVPEAMRWFLRAREIDPDSDSEGGMIQAYAALNLVDRVQPWMERFRSMIEDGDIRELSESRYEYIVGDERVAVQKAARLLESPSKFLHQQRRILLWMVRNADLAAGEFETAHGRYARYFPELLEQPPRVNRRNLRAAIDLALVLQKLDRPAEAAVLLDGASAMLAQTTRFGTLGFSTADAEIAALRGDKPAALAALRRAIAEGWRFYYLETPDRNPNLALLHGDAEYAAVMQEVKDRIAEQAGVVAAMEQSGEIPLLAAAAE